MFLTLITGIERGGEITEGYNTTGDLIPLLPGDPGVFKTLADKQTNAPPCWLPDSFDGIEWLCGLDEHIEGLDYGGEISHDILRSLARAGLLNLETGMFRFQQDAASVRAWKKWHRENGTEPHGPQELHGGDMHIGMNELLLSDEDSILQQEAEAASCTAPRRFPSNPVACACNNADVEFASDSADSDSDEEDEADEEEMEDEEGSGEDEARQKRGRARARMYQKKREKVEFLGNDPQVGRCRLIR